MVEILNMSSIGPNLRLAPKADPGDRRLDVVIATENDGAAALREQWHCAAPESARSDGALTSRRAGKITIWPGRHLIHVDDQIHRAKAGERRPAISISVEPAQVEFLVP